jgi:hypothetical protein
MNWIEFFSLTAGAAIPGLLLLAVLARHGAAGGTVKGPAARSY